MISRVFNGEMAVVLVVVAVAFGTVFGFAAVISSAVGSISPENQYRQTGRTLTDLERNWR